MPEEIKNTEQTSGEINNNSVGVFQNTTKVNFGDNTDNNQKSDEQTNSTELEQDNNSSSDTGGDNTDEKNTNEQDQVIEIKGRKFTIPELTKAYENSSLEGMRLYQETQQLKSKLKSQQNIISELQTKLDEIDINSENPPFKILSKEELLELSEDDRIDYKIKLREWEKEKELKKQRIEEFKKNKEMEIENLKKVIIQKDYEMANDENNYPNYSKLRPTMESILDKMPYLAGKEETPELLYYLAVGLNYIHSKKEGNKINKEETGRTAKNVSQMANGMSGVSSTAKDMNNTQQQEDTDELLSQRIIAKARKPVFS